MNLQEAFRGLLGTESIAQLMQAVNMSSVVGEETKTSGALTLGVRTSLLSVTGTVAFTLADGTFTGQRHTCRCTAAASTPAGTLTPAHFADGTSILFDAVNEQVDLEWNGTAWRVCLISGATVS